MSLIDGPTRSFANNAALGKGIRVVETAGNLAAADASTVAYGVMEYRTLAGDEQGTVRLRTAAGTRLMVASGAITKGNSVYAAASGKVASSGTVLEGTALEAAAADGDVIEVLPTDLSSLSTPTIASPTLTLTVQALAAAGSAQGDAGAITAASGAFVHATGADATKGIVLPTAAAGKMFIIKNSDAANAVLKVYPNTSDAINALSVNAAISMAAKTSALFIALDAVTWYTLPLLPS